MNGKFRSGAGDTKRAALGIGVGFLAMLAMTGAVARLVLEGVLGRESMGLASALILLAGSFLGGLCCGRGGDKGVRFTVAAGGLILVLLAVNLLLFDGRLNGLLPGSLVIAGGTSAAALLTAGKGTKNRKYRVGRRKYR